MLFIGHNVVMDNNAGEVESLIKKKKKRVQRHVVDH